MLRLVIIVLLACLACCATADDSVVITEEHVQILSKWMGKSPEDVKQGIAFHLQSIIEMDKAIERFKNTETLPPDVVSKAAALLKINLDLLDLLTQMAEPMLERLLDIEAQQQQAIEIQ